MSWLRLRIFVRSGSRTPAAQEKRQPTPAILHQCGPTVACLAPRVTTVAIHQPNYFPWLGYFAKIARSDVFVFLDHVEYSRRSWINRVRIKTGPESSKWLSIPTHTTRGTSINDVVIADDLPWRNDHLSVLQHNYRRANCFGEVFPVVRSLLMDTDRGRLADFNIAVIVSLCRLLDLRLNHRRSSALDCAEKRNELMLEITRSQGGDSYLCGDGAGDYMDVAPFAAVGVSVQYANFAQLEYPQVSAGFMPGLSILDALFNVGFERTRALICQQS